MESNMDDKIEEILLDFQIYLNSKGLITSHDWDWEKEIKKFLKKRNGK